MTQENRLRRPDGAWVIIFNVGQDNEGVYTHTRSQAATSILGFECEQDAHHFAPELLANGFGVGTPVHWSAAQLSRFSHTAGFVVSMVPRGTQPAPPSNTAAPQLGDQPEPPTDRAPMQPEDRPMRRDDPYISYRLWLEDLLMQPDDCGDDDCIIR